MTVRTFASLSPAAEVLVIGEPLSGTGKAGKGTADNRALRGSLSLLLSQGDVLKPANAALLSRIRFTRWHAELSLYARNPGELPAATIKAQRGPPGPRHA